MAPLGRHKVSMRIKAGLLLAVLALGAAAAVMAVAVWPGQPRAAGPGVGEPGELGGLAAAPHPAAPQPPGAPEGAPRQATGATGEEPAGVDVADSAGVTVTTPAPVNRPQLLAGLPSSWQLVAYNRATASESWRLRNGSGCREAAQELLYNLRAQGCELVQAGYLDLSGEAWGCSVQEGGGAVWTLTLMPQVPLAERSATNQLNLVATRFMAPGEA